MILIKYLYLIWYVSNFINFKHSTFLIIFRILRYNYYRRSFDVQVKCDKKERDTNFIFEPRWYDEVFLLFSFVEFECSSYLYFCGMAYGNL